MRFDSLFWETWKGCSQYGSDLLSNNIEGSFSVLISTIYLLPYTQSPSLLPPIANMASLQDPQILSPSTQMSPQKGSAHTSNCSHRPCFTIFLAFTIIWNDCIYLSVPAFIACLLPPCWDIHDCSSYSLLTVTLPTPPPHIPRRAHGQIGGAQ